MPNMSTLIRKCLLLFAVWFAGAGSVAAATPPSGWWKTLISIGIFTSAI